MDLDRRHVPALAWPALELAERWDISDDFDREAAINSATIDDLRDRVDAVDAFDETVWDWLSGPISYDPKATPEYVAITAVTRAADSARLKFRDVG